MAKETDDFKFESLQDASTIIKYLDALQSGFKKNKIVLGTDKEKIVLKPHGLIKLELKAREKDSRVKISLKCSWKSKSSPGDSGKGLSIES